MATNDIYNTSGTTTGNEKRGTVVVKANRINTKTYSPNGSVNVSISDQTDNYQNVGSMPRYYSGDNPN